jgi:hypothetical protein
MHEKFMSKNVTRSFFRGGGGDKNKIIIIMRNIGILIEKVKTLVYAFTGIVQQIFTFILFMYRSQYVLTIKYDL